MNTDKNECKKHKWIPLLGFDKGKSIPTSLFTCLKCGDLKVGARTIKISQHRMDMGGLPIYQLQEMRLMNPPTAVNTASGLVVSAIVDSDVSAVGTPLFMNDSSHLQITDADSDVKSPCVALALETGGNGDSKRVLVHGILKTSDNTWAMGNGKANLIYISRGTGTGAGKLIQHATMLTELTGLDDVIQPVGWALAHNLIYFSPSMIYLTHAA